MANKDSLGDRMKENYENRFKFKLLRRTPVIVRTDGRSFHVWTRGFNKPFDKVLSNAMDKTMKQLCENIQDMLMQKYNVNWNKFPVRYKRGCACCKMNVTENETERSKWLVDYDMPIITQDREYVEKWIKLNNDENKKKTNY